MSVLDSGTAPDRPARRGVQNGCRFLVALVLCWAVGLAGGAGAEEPSIRVRLDPQRLGVDDLTRLTIQIVEPGNDRPAPDLGQLVNFEVVQGPSTETQFSWVNGKATSSLSLSWILRPQGVGSAVVGPVTVQVGSRELAGGAVTAEIVPGSLHAQPRTGRRTGPFGRVDPFADFFGGQRPGMRQAKVELRQFLSRSTVADGQPLVATVALDTTGGGVDGFEWIEVPQYPGWWVQKLDRPDRIEAEVVTVDGEPFNRFVLQQLVLIPLGPGTLRIPEVKARIGFRGRSVFAPHSVVERSTNAVDVTVKPRPAGPENFSGAVGDMQYRATLEPSTIPFGGSAVLTITLEGEGNLPLVREPDRWPTCSDCEVYPPEEDSDITIDRAGIRGSRTWRATVLPRTSGEVDFEAVELPVFNPRTGTYTLSRLGPFTMTVEPPPPTPTPEGAAPAMSGNLKEPVLLPDGTGGESAPVPLPLWIVIGSALAVGVFGGGLVAWLVTRRRGGVIPPRRHGQSPAERARELQMAMEQWWVGLSDDQKNGATGAEHAAVRKALETIRFAPGRADHSETVRELEKRMRALMR